jgi:hypothetical protein
MAEWPRSGPYLRALAEWGFDSRLATRFAILGRNLFVSPGARASFLYYCGVVVIFLSLFSRNWDIRKKQSRGLAALRGVRGERGNAEGRGRSEGTPNCNAHSVATDVHPGWPKATYSRKMTDSTADVGAVTGSTETAPPRAGHQIGK